MDTATTTMDPPSTTSQAETTPSRPPFPLDPCSPDYIPHINFSNYSLSPGMRYCQINWRTYEPERVSACCGNNSQVLVQDNCTQFCLTNNTHSQWSTCLRDTVIHNGSFGFGCDTVPDRSWAPSPVSTHTALAPLMLVALVLFGRIL